MAATGEELAEAHGEDAAIGVWGTVPAEGADMTTVRWSAVKFCHTAQTSLPASLALAGLVG